MAYAHTLARGLLAVWARASTVPDETVQALTRALTRARHDLVESQSAARQRLHDELVPVFPELVGQRPEHADLGTPAVLRLLNRYSSAQALAQAALDELSRMVEEVSEHRWGRTHAQALQALAQHSTASSRAVAARARVVRRWRCTCSTCRRASPRWRPPWRRCAETILPASTCKAQCLAWGPCGRPPSVLRWATSPA